MEIKYPFIPYSLSNPLLLKKKYILRNNGRLNNIFFHVQLFLLYNTTWISLIPCKSVFCFRKQFSLKFLIKGKKKNV